MADFRKRDEEKKQQKLSLAQGLKMANGAISGGGGGSGGSGESGESGVGNTDTASGLLSGSATGAAIGTQIMPGWGTAIGAVVGGVSGALSAKSNRRKQVRKDTALAEAKKQEALSQIEGEKANRMNNALTNLQQSFANTLNQRKNVRF